MDEDRLMASVAAGDNTALRELFDRHSPWVAARLRRAMPAAAVEDVVQETFIAVWRGARGYTGEGAVGAWIWGIARRQAALWMRRNPPSEATSAPEYRESPDTTAIRSVDLQHALSSLGPEGNESRELVRLVFEEDRTVADVAGLLGIPEGTVKSRVFKLRRRLRATLRKGGYDAASS